MAIQQPACHAGTGACGIIRVHQHAAGSGAGRSFHRFRAQLVHAPWRVSAMSVARHRQREVYEGQRRDQRHTSSRTAHDRLAGHVTSWILRAIVIAARHRSDGHLCRQRGRRLGDHGRENRDSDNQRKENAHDIGHIGNVTQTLCFCKWICRERRRPPDALKPPQVSIFRRC